MWTTHLRRRGAPMEQDRRADQPDNNTTEPSASGAEGQRSSTQRRTGSDSATRDYQQKMTELDAAGTVEEAHDRKAAARAVGRRPSGVAAPDRGAGASEQAGGDGGMRMSRQPRGEEPSDPGGDAADGRKKADAAKSDGKRVGSRLRDKMGRHTATFGLAASSLALLA